ncbi:hypothetical protein ACXZ83_00725 [Streptococcus agalactiae]|uniref:hypothetical protein n=1 Tax=Streptococcus agalactiae TaxID=1311 RepID=UPI0002EA5A43|nr:hypothetical protein [Streptococcus agalactiae]EPX04604.1 hypothetical protein SAG0163_01580 [Streptococcus agalactiae MRI Z1-215]OCL40049.1 hypothetical protein AX277_04610 [Streptococcus agalactiae]
MTSLQKSTTDLALTQLASPFQLRIAKDLSQTMAVNQAKELLATDLLYKVGKLALIQDEILSDTPEAKAYTEHILKAFTYYSAEHLK